MKYIAGFFFLLVALTSHAAIYMQKDANGNITYSDSPLSNAKKIDVPDGNSTLSTTKNAGDETAQAVDMQPPLTKPSDSNAAPTASTDRKPYKTFVILSPEDQASIQNQVVIPVSLKIDPALQPGDAIQLYVDNQPMGRATNNSHPQLSNLERGTHQIVAKLIDSNKRVLRESNSITIYVHRASLNNRP